jgi:hypothetical protein
MRKLMTRKGWQKTHHGVGKVCPSKSYTGDPQTLWIRVLAGSWEHAPSFSFPFLFSPLLSPLLTTPPPGYRLCYHNEGTKQIAI